MKCQSFMQPSSAWYWHMGETTTRLGSVTGPICSGVKSLAGMERILTRTSDPAAHAAAVLDIRGAEARFERALLQRDLEAVDIGDEERQADERGQVGEPYGPGGEKHDIAHVHRIAGKPVDARRYEDGALGRPHGVHRGAGAAELEESEGCNRQA